MKSLLTKYSCTFFLAFILLTLSLPTTKFANSDTTRPTAPEAKASDAHPRAEFANLPLSFEVNVGQSNSQVRFLSRNSGYNLFLTEKEAVLSITPSTGSSSKKGFSAKPQAAQSSVVRIKPYAANPRAVIEGLEPLESKSNYLVGREAQGWRTNVAHYAKVAYRSIYPGVDLIYYGNQRQIEYDFVLSPDADASRIALDISGAKSLKIADNGDLLINTASGLIHQLAPKAYQDIDGARQAVASRYVLVGKRKIGFALGNYDKSKPLVIDPVLSYSTFLGGTGDDNPQAIATDAAGNLYITGTTNSVDFPITAGAVRSVLNGGGYPFNDAFVTKINSSGTAIIYSTFIGGSSSEDSGSAIVIDSVGNAYVGGYTSSNNFPLTAGAFQTTYRDYQDAFLLKLNSTGSTLLYSSYLGGEWEDYIRGIALDSADNLYVAGETKSAAFPTSPGALQPGKNLENCGSYYPCSDAFIAKFNLSTNTRIFSTYFGGNGYEGISEITIGGDGSIYVSGSTTSTSLYTTLGAFQTVRSGRKDYDGFVAKLNASGNSVLYSTFLGGSKDDNCLAMVLDGAGNVTLTGSTASIDFPVTSGAYKAAMSSGDGGDAYVAKLNATGSALVYSTYFGGSDYDDGSHLALDAEGNIYILGTTISRTLPTTANALQRTFGGGDRDTFFAKLNATGSQALYSSYIGGTGLEIPRGLALASSGQAYILGYTNSADFVTTPGALKSQLGGSYDGFLIKLSLNEVGYSISGHVRTNLGNPLNGVSVSISGPISRTLYTDENGYYSMGSLPPGGSYTLNAYRDSYPYEVANQTIANLSQNETVDFSGASSLIISGKITGGYNVEVALSGDTNNVTTTDSEGRYAFRYLLAGGNYTVTPNSTYYLIAPGSLSVQNLDGDKSLNFTATPPPSITGQVTDEYGNKISGVTVSLSGTMSWITTTDYEGNYSFPFLQRGGNYTITPGPYGNNTFAPTNQSLENLPADQAVNFTMLYPLYIGGRVMDQSGYGVSNVTISLSGSASQTTQTGYDGSYSFYDLTRGGTYTVTPTDSRYVFSPESQTFANMTTRPTQDFTALPFLNIYGRAMKGGSEVIVGATITLSGTVSATTQTDSNGYYYLNNLPRNGTYTVTATHPSYNFTPPSETFSNMTFDQFRDFSGTLKQFTISGVVKDVFLEPISEVTITISGYQNATTQTDSNGNYSFTGLTATGDYLITAAKAGFTFNPRTIVNLTGNQTENFIGTRVTYAISGRITDSNSNALYGVTIILSGSVATGTSTDANGNYSFSELPSEGNYTITPSLTNHTFSPTSRTVTNLLNNQTADFTGTRFTYSISGRIADSANAALAGVTVTLTGGQTGSTQTDSDGNYSFAALPAGLLYNLTPSKAYYTFLPPLYTFANLGSNHTANFTGTRLTYTVSGRVSNASNVGQAGVSLTLAGGQSATTQTDAAGNYSFAALGAGLDYTITPAKNHYSFSPTSRSLTNLSGNQSADFTATLLQHNITGTILNSGGSPMAGVTVALSGSQTNSTTTDASGNYAFVALAAGGNYAVSAAKQFYGFSPTLQSFNDLGGNQTANFTGTLLTYAITGRVTEGSAGVAGVLITLGGNQTGSVQTDAAGNFTFSGLAAGGTYTTTASHPFFAFSPTSRSFASLSQNQTSDFIAARLTYQVSGSVLNVCTQAIAGVTMTLSHDGISVTAQTNASGVYSFTGVQAGFNYSLTPALTGHTFNPTSASFVALNANQTANFIATPPTATINVPPTADAYLRGGSNANNNFGNATQLITRLASSASNTYESYLTFDVGQLCTASSVKLRLYGKSSSSGNLGVSVYSVANTSWVETAINWNNKPVTGALLATTTLTGTTNAWYEWDITQYVQNELSAGRRIISIALKGVTNTSNQATLNSRQATSNQPELRIIKP